MNAAPERVLYPVEEVSARLGGIGRTSLYALMNSGQLERVKIGRRTFITASSVAEYVDRLREVSR